MELLYEKLEKLEKRIRDAAQMISMLRSEKMELEVKCQEIEKRSAEQALELEMLRSEKDKLASRIEALLGQFDSFGKEAPRKYESQMEILGAAPRQEEAREETPVVLESHAELEADDCAACFEEGLELESKRKFEEAIAAYQRAIEANPNYVSAIEHLAFLLEKLNREKEALPLWEKLVALRR